LSLLEGMFALLVLGRLAFLMRVRRSAIVSLYMPTSSPS